MIEIHIRQAPITHEARETQGWRAHVVGSPIREAGPTYAGTLGMLLLSLIASRAVNISIKEVCSCQSK